MPEQPAISIKNILPRTITFNVDPAKFVNDGHGNMVCAAFLIVDPRGKDHSFQMGPGQTRLIMDYIESKDGLAAMREAGVNPNG